MKEFRLVKTNDNYLTPDFFGEDLISESEYIEPPFIVRQEYDLTLDNESIGGAKVIEIKLSTIINYEESAYNVFDGDSLTISDFGDEVIDKETNDLKDEILSEFDEFLSGDLVYIDNLFIESHFRNKKLGTNLILNVLNDYIGNHFLIAVKPYPYEIKPINKKEFKQRKEDLIKFYKQFGFTEVKGIKNYLFLNKLT